MLIQIVLRIAILTTILLASIALAAYVLSGGFYS